MTTDPGFLALLQLSDSFFPTGGFAHSFGLETYVQDGRVRNRDDVEAFIVAHLEGSTGPADAVAVAETSRLAPLADVAGSVAIDERLDAMKLVPEFRTGSLQMGRQTLRVITALPPDPYLESLGHAVDEGRMRGHHAVVFGAALGRQGIDAERAAAAFLYTTSALLVGASLRLLPLGQVEGQRVLASLRPRILRLGSMAATRTVDDMWSFNPGLEIAGIRHARLDARLFRS